MPCGVTDAALRIGPMHLYGWAVFMNSKWCIYWNFNLVPALQQQGRRKLARFGRRAMAGPCNWVLKRNIAKLYERFPWSQRLFTIRSQRVPKARRHFSCQRSLLQEKLQLLLKNEEKRSHESRFHCETLLNTAIRARRVSFRPAKTAGAQFTTGLVSAYQAVNASQ